MCGILGIISFKRKFNHEKDEKIFENMLETLVHRGPDDYGTWINNNRNVYFAHRRLSIIDLSVNAKQPMHSISKRFSIVFNGEIYNYKEIALKLIKAGFYDFNKDSDTSVLLAAIDKWGLNQTIPKLVGMIAFALWGNENERAIANEIKHQSANINVNVLEALSFDALISLINQVDLVIGADTGPTHMAWALNIPSITLFGPTPGLRNTYITKINKVIESDSVVNPRKINKNDYSIKDISVNHVVKISEFLLHINQ